jgi:hypothetical protein
MKSRSLQSADRRLVRLLVLSGMAGMFWLVSAGVATADNTTTNTPPAATAATNAPAATTAALATAAKPEKEKAAKKLSGVELYAIHCNRCHPERAPVEFNESQWKTVIMHMRVRANLPAEQAREILKYMEDQAGY